MTAAVATALTLVALPSLVPLESYRAGIEEAASERLGEAVTIGRLRASVLPTPHVTAYDVVVGHDKDLKIGSVAIRPRLTSLLSSPKVLREVEIRDVEAEQDSVGRLLAVAAPPPDKPRAVRIERLLFDNALVRTRKSEIGPFSAVVELKPTGEPSQAVLRGDSDKLRVTVVPESERYAVTVEAKNWTLPWGPSLAFDTLVMKGTASRGLARFDDVSAEAYGGAAHGEVRIGWKDGMEVSGTLALKKVDLAALLGAFSKKSPVTGRLDAKPVFRARAENSAGLREALRIEGPFKVHNGVLRGIDLQGAASLTKQDGKTGDTKFDELSGVVVAERGSYRFNNLKAASGALAARGDVTVARKNLSGRVYAQLQPLGAAAEVPLNVAGTVDAPSVMPSGGSIAGAAVGTAVLGPGIGTTVGAKIGELTERVFGSGEKAKPRQ